tara:strand:+ start:3364 stop:4119 length:756 start_codon:yes stop_codon:yes gene_type:complete
MPVIKQIYRYPIKSFTPEMRKKVFVNKNGKITGDRIAAFRIGDDDFYDGNWLPKKNYLSLMHIPYLALIKLNFNDSLTEIAIKVPNNEKYIYSKDKTYIIEEKINDFLITKGVNKKFRLIFPNNESSFHDTKSGGISLHSIESENELNKYIKKVNGEIFRSNLIINGCGPFEEFSWIGKRIQIGSLIFKVVKAIPRCNAVNCNLDEGIYDQNILKVLPNSNSIDTPSFGIKLELISSGGEITENQEVKIIS